MSTIWSTWLDLSNKNPLMPTASATAAKEGLFRLICHGISPAACISNWMKSRQSLLYTTIFTGSLYWTIVMRSPSSMDRPPSPHRAITCRSGYSICAPIAIGMALAMEP